MIIGIRIICKSCGNKELTLFGIMTIVLVSGDSFHLIPRIFAAINQTGDYGFWLGTGKLITSLTVTVFYLPVVLWTNVHAMIGMLMLPKTCMYIWIVIMSFKEIKQ